MKPVITKAFLAALLVSSTLLSCKKEKEDPKPEPCSKTMNGIAGTYKLSSLKYKISPTAAEQDALIFLDACERDDILKLNANGTSSLQDAGIVCSPSGDDNGTWSVTGNTITSDGIVNGTISSYDCKTLVYYLENQVISGDRYTFTLTKQ
jgi:Lipocalin-like domain